MIKFVTDALKNRDEEKGFSLVELIVVVAILGILVVIAIPVYGAIQDTARHNALETGAANGATSVAAALANGSTAASAITNLNKSADIKYTLASSTATAPTLATPGAAAVAFGTGTKAATTAANGTTDTVYVYAVNKNGEWAGAGTAAASTASWK